jgi:succinate-semialdehyde dehydrogenase / glutarate-semialdehyde dehydrogenase
MYDEESGMREQTLLEDLCANYAPCSLIAGDAVRDTEREVPVINPSTGSTLGSLPLVGPAQVNSAIRAAVRGFALWHETPLMERVRVLRRAAALLEAGRTTLASLITLELGKPYAQSLVEAATAAEMFDWAAEETRRTYGRVIPSRERGMHQYTVWEPIGPVAGFSGWNAPAITPARKISGALAAGCSIVMKPSEETPQTALFIAQCLIDAGLPPEVCNIVFGSAEETASVLLDDPRIRMITFTGSTQVGKQLAARCAATLKRATLELGGYAPVLIFADADVDHIAASGAMAAFRNSGQVCTSPTRFIVHESVYARFTERFAAHANALRTGVAANPATQMGPLANERGVARAERLVDDAVRHGARVVAGGKRLERPGHFFAPTVLADVSNDCAIANEEPFSPVKAVTPFHTFNEAMDLANRLPYGLAAYAWTTSDATTAKVSEAMQSGAIAINHWRASLPETPFGGIKESGIGLEGSTEGVLAFMQQRFVSRNAAIVEH